MTYKIAVLSPGQIAQLREQGEFLEADSYPPGDERLPYLQGERGTWKDYRVITYSDALFDPDPATLARQDERGKIAKWLKRRFLPGLARDVREFRHYEASDE